MRRLLPAILALTAAALVACGGGEDAEPAAGTDCGFVGFTANSDDGVFGIEARGVGCPEAKEVARAARGVAFGDGTPRYEADGFACTGTATDDDLPGVAYRCTRGDALVTFTRT